MNYVRKTCFTTKLSDDWEDALDDFAKKLTEINDDSIKKVLPSFDKVSVIVQGHILMFHVKEFIQQTGMALGQVATQSHESFHPRFLNYYERLALNPASKDFSEKFRRCVAMIAAENAHFCPEFMKNYFSGEKYWNGNLIEQNVSNEED